MVNSKKISFRNLAPANMGAALAAFACTAGAQMVPPITSPAACFFNLDYAVAPIPPAPVPSMSMLGVALLMSVIGFLAWRKGRFPGARFMAFALVMAAATLANQGGGGLIQKAYAAAVGINLSNPLGGSVANTFARNGDVVTVTNSTGTSLLISSITSSVSGISAPTLGGCSTGATLAPGASCNATVASCESCSRPAVYFGGQCNMCPAGSIWRPNLNTCERFCVPGAPGC